MATWLKDGEPVDTKTIGVRNSFVDSVLFIRSAERDHSGKYTLVLKIENMEDTATIDIRIVGKIFFMHSKHRQCGQLKVSTL